MAALRFQTGWGHYKDIHGLPSEQKYESLLFLAVGDYSTRKAFM